MSVSNTGRRRGPFRKPVNSAPEAQTSKLVFDFVNAKKRPAAESNPRRAGKGFCVQDYTAPCAIMAEATLRKPAMFAPVT